MWGRWETIGAVEGHTGTVVGEPTTCEVGSISFTRWFYVHIHSLCSHSQHNRRERGSYGSLYSRTLVLLRAVGHYWRHIYILVDCGQRVSIFVGAEQDGPRE